MRNQVEEDTVAMISNMYPCLYTSPPQPPPQQAGEVKQRRRRRKKVRSNEGAKKRKLSDDQVEMLERSFGFEHKLESDRKDKLAAELGLDPRQVAVWFQNRRARWKNKKLEDEYSRLRAEHDATVLHKCNLETQVLKLREELEEAQKEIRRLSDQRSSEIASSNSPSSSLTMEAINPTMLLGEYNIGNFDNPFYMEGDSYVVPCLDWNLYDM